VQLLDRASRTFELAEKVWIENINSARKLDDFDANRRLDFLEASIASAQIFPLDKLSR
jgi:hypothetical protein